MSSSAVRAWRFALQGRSFRVEIIISLASLLACGWIAPFFFQYIQQRDGVQLHDSLLAALPAMDLSVPIFTILYTLIVVSVFALLAHPDKFLIALQAYVILTLVRFITLYVVPLEPPADLVPLNDPFVSLFFYQEIITKDLFFSGHTSILVLLGLSISARWLKIVVLLGATVIGILVLLQHVHYTIDVVAAPVFAGITYFLVVKIKTGNF